MVTMDTCYTCAQERLFDRLPIRERIAHDDHWRVAHATGTSLEAWLILMPRRHVTTIAELSDAEAGLLGTWQVRLSRALHAVTGCEKTYVVQFAEAPGFAHVHFHVVPRSPDHPYDRRGPAIFSYLGCPPDKQVSPRRMDLLGAQLRSSLGPH
ncbi:MAG: hypothetical protein QG671_2030 [Actinomycetota bacterium]|nr:hypothetical protein [Actinomycetota bacterium]